MKLGSLFSGSGGFELGGAMHGIEPVWASEIENFNSINYFLWIPKQMNFI